MRTPGRLVIRAHAPARRWLLLASLILLAGLGLYVMFQLGRYKAGFDGVRAANERARLEAQIQQLQDQQHELRVQLEAADQQRLAEVRERTDVARTIGELQAQVANAQQELAFYRGLVTQQLPQSPGLKIQQFRISAPGPKGQFRLHFTVSRSLKPEELFSATLTLTVEGERGGSAASADLASLTAAKRPSLPLSFRYFTTVEQTLQLPSDFSASRVTIEIRPLSKTLASYRQTLLWTVEAR